MRVKNCCCGCSLRTGTLILLWGGLIFEIFAIKNGLLIALSPYAKPSFLTTAKLPWDVISLVLIIVALVGVYKRRPSCLLPYIGFCALGLILLALLALLVLIGPSALRHHIIAHFVRNVPKTTKYEAKVAIMIFSSVITMAIWSYFIVVLYSHYRQLQEDLADIADRQNKEIAVSNNPNTNGPQTVPYPWQNLVRPSPLGPIYAQQNTVYFQQSTVYGPLPAQNL